MSGIWAKFQEILYNIFYIVSILTIISTSWIAKQQTCLFSGWQQKKVTSEKKKRLGKAFVIMVEL